MKQFLKIARPCEEKIENMHSIPEGKFCDLCNKKVYDLTNKTNEEILALIKDNTEGELCGFVKKGQFDFPVLETSKEETKIISSQISIYPKIAAASVLIATGLAASSCSTSTIHRESNIVAQNQKTDDLSKEETEEEKEQLGSDKNTIFAGQIIDKDTKKPIINAEITFICLEKVLKTNTDTNGNYKLEIPNRLIQDKNVIQYDFEKIKVETELDSLGVKKSYYYTSESKILKKEEIKMNNSMAVLNQEYPYYMVGGMVAYSKKTEFIYFLDGEEIDENDYYRLLNKGGYEKYYFTGEIAEILYGEKVEDGLCLLFSKEN